MLCVFADQFDSVLGSRRSAALQLAWAPMELVGSNSMHLPGQRELVAAGGQGHPKHPCWRRLGLPRPPSAEVNTGCLSTHQQPSSLHITWRAKSLQDRARTSLAASTLCLSHTGRT